MSFKIATIIGAQNVQNLQFALAQAQDARLSARKRGNKKQVVVKRKGK